METEEQGMMMMMSYSCSSSQHLLRSSPSVRFFHSSISSIVESSHSSAHVDSGPEFLQHGSVNLSPEHLQIHCVVKFAV
ncbi:unnamed protein product [Calypogeia fissa]